MHRCLEETVLGMQLGTIDPACIVLVAILFGITLLIYACGYIAKDSTMITVYTT